jgi:hypothetical protein
LGSAEIILKPNDITELGSRDFQNGGVFQGFDTMRRHRREM